jgi:hypothetical protein
MNVPANCVMMALGASVMRRVICAQPARTGSRQ